MNEIMSLWDFQKEKNKKNKKKFSVLLPPPNITGELHLGHALDSVIPDIIVREKIINGFHTTWVPGTDHAGIATHLKIIQSLAHKKKLTKKEYIEEFRNRRRYFKKKIRKQ